MNSRHDKLVARFLSRPKDFRWSELVRLLEGFGFRLEKGGRTSGSRVRFVRDGVGHIYVHKPHPQKIIKPGAMSDILRQLREKGLV